MSRRAALAILGSLLLAACASAMDATRNGEPVLEATFKDIFDDPGQWEGKWVRLSGWIDSEAKMIVHERNNDNDWWTLYLDPQRKLSGRESEVGLPGQAAIVSGRVDLTCAGLFAEGYRALLAQGFVGEVSAKEPGPNAYCNRAQGPNLVDVLVSKPSESLQ